ncbi:MAG: four helix bundle protein [bacterium]|nr:four helix bundle protein [bacterium]
MNTTASAPTTEPKTYSTFRFVDYKVYQESKKWFQEVSSLKGILESSTDLWYQLKNNITSVVMNIAAASTKLPLEARNYLGGSITAANKAVACLDMACDLQAISLDEFKTLSEGYKGIIIQLKSFIKALGARKESEAEQSAA